MRAIIVGYGNQGEKRWKVAQEEIVAIVDPSMPPRDFGPVGIKTYTDIEDVPLGSFEAAIVCTPTDNQKYGIVRYFVQHGKHVLVEKPLWPATSQEIVDLEALARRNNVFCMVGYNHHFEPAIQMLRMELASYSVGQPYHCRMFYGNGTVQNVKNSWRAKIPLGVVPEVGSHLLDLTARIFKYLGNRFEFDLVCGESYESGNLDHALLISRVDATSGNPCIQLEMSYLSWKNTFTIDLLCSRGSLHVEGLTKWGRSTFTKRTRILPSGVPSEEGRSWVQPDRTWLEEWRYFGDGVKEKQETNLAISAWIAQALTFGEKAKESGKDEGSIRWYDAPWQDAQESHRDTRSDDDRQLEPSFVDLYHSRR